MLQSNDEGPVANVATGPSVRPCVADGRRSEDLGYFLHFAVVEALSFLVIVTPVASV